MSRIIINLESTSALKPSEYRQFVRGWKPHPLLKSIFAKQTGSDKKFRIIKSLSGSNVKITAEVPPTVKQAVEKANCSITPIDYIRGYVQDKHGRLVKIGKILKAESPESQIFVSDERRKHDLRILNKENYVVVISIHPYDLAGMSTDRAWTSCMDLRNVKYDKRLNVKSEIDNHSIIAYLVDVNDPNISKPFARVLAKKFTSEAGTEVYKIDAAYPIQDKMLSAMLNEWLDTHVNPRLPKVENDYTTYSLPESSYRDGDSDSEISLLNIIKTEDAHNLFHYSKNLLPSRPNIIKFFQVTQGIDLSSLPTDYATSRKILTILMMGMMYSESSPDYINKQDSLKYTALYLKHFSRTSKLNLAEELLTRVAGTPSNTLMLFSDYSEMVLKFDDSTRAIRSKYESVLLDFINHFIDLNAKTELLKKVIPRTSSQETFLMDVLENLDTFMLINASPSLYYGVLAVNWQTLDNIMTKEELLYMFERAYSSLHKHFAYTKQINTSFPERSKIGGYWGMMIALLCVAGGDLFDSPEEVEFETLASVLRDLEQSLASKRTTEFNPKPLQYIHEESVFSSKFYDSTYKRRLESLMNTLPLVKEKTKLRY